MAQHRFGGSWTEDKLERLERYLKEYRKIFSANPKAQYFTTWYVDAFAGTGSRAQDAFEGSDSQLAERAQTTAYFEGSARRALASPFDRYLFIEKSRQRITELKAMVAREFAELAERCEFRPEDANTALCDWCAERNWKRDRAVVFLDPYGLQVEWKTIQSLGATKGVDLWYLFPLNSARLLTYDPKIDDAWQRRLDLLFGTHEWQTRFYKTRTKEDLFGIYDIVQREATVENIKEFIEERLGSCFHKVAKGLVLKNSNSSPMYSLCFAAANERGAPPALRIAQYILDN